MDFRLSEEQAMLRDASRRLLQDRSGSAAVRALLSSPDDADPALLSLAADLGWVGLAVPEEHGGSGQGLIELSVVAEEIGRANARAPFVPSALVARAVAVGASAQLQAEVLPGLADGSTSAAWAFGESRRRWTPTAVRTTAVHSGEDVLLAGTKTAVQDAGSAHWLLVTASLAGTPSSFLVPANTPGVTLRRQTVLDVTRNLYAVTLDDVRVPRTHQVATGTEAVQALLDDAAVLTSAESLGGAERLFEMTLDYAKTRFQFGRAIGSFQSIKHKCATMRMLLQGCRAATYYAGMAVDVADPNASRAASVAKAFVSDAASRIAGEALQVHGGIGFTWEHDVHLFLRRLKTSEALYGDVATHRDRLCALLLADRLATSA